MRFPNPFTRESLIAFRLSVYIIEVVSLIEYSSCFKNIYEKSNLFIRMLNLWIDCIVVLSDLAEIVYVNGFYMYARWQVIMPSPASHVFNLLAFKILF